MAAEGDLDREAFATRAVEQGPFTAVLEARIAVARAERDAAGRPGNPSLSWDRVASLSGGRADESEDDLALHLPLVLSGRLGLENEAGAAAALAEDARARWGRARARREARLAFDTVLAARARVAILAKAAAATEELNRVLSAREKAGESAGYDRERMELEAALVSDLRAAAEAEQAGAEAAAAVLLGATGMPLPTLAGDVLAETGPLPQATPDTLEARPDVQALAREAQAAEAAAKAANRKAVPDPALTAGVRLLDVAESRRGVGYVVGVEVPLPLLDSGAREADVARARARAAEAERVATWRQAVGEVAAARVTAVTRRARVAAHQRDVVQRAERLVGLAAKAWRAGGAELLTLIDAQRAAREAHLAALALAVEARRAETDLLFLTGAEK
jgi:cobalt-zinc-cadmium efflux system outer membrane protein